ncbi:MAG: hypothetical protein R3C56_36525 [Pirellulaceae bacterium]
MSLRWSMACRWARFIATKPSSRICCRRQAMCSDLATLGELMTDTHRDAYTSLKSVAHLAIVPAPNEISREAHLDGSTSRVTSMAATWSSVA